MREAGKYYVQLSVLVRKEGKEYASWCPEIDVASSGKSVEQSCKNLEDAIHSYLETYNELGELSEVLAERGIVLEGEKKCSSLFLTEARIGVPTTP